MSQAHKRFRRWGLIVLLLLLPAVVAVFSPSLHSADISMQNILNKDIRPHARAGEYKKAFRGYDRLIALIKKKVPEANPEKKAAIEQVRLEKYSYAYECADKMISENKTVMGGARVKDVLRALEPYMEKDGFIPSPQVVQMKQKGFDTNIMGGIYKKDLLALPKKKEKKRTAESDASAKADEYARPVYDYVYITFFSDENKMNTAFADLKSYIEGSIAFRVKIESRKLTSSEGYYGNYLIAVYTAGQGEGSLIWKNFLKNHKMRSGLDAGSESKIRWLEANSHRPVESYEKNAAAGK